MTRTTKRDAGLKQMPIEHRRNIQDGVQGRICDERAGRPVEVRDHLECSDAHIQGDIQAAGARPL